MRQKYSWFTIREILAVLTLAVMLAAPAVAVSKYRVLHEFKGKDGEYPYGDLIFDTTGNLYGTTYFGGANNGGTVFKLIPHVDGSWTESVLYSFCSLKNCTDGYLPTAGLISDSSGNLYGTTDELGGVFKLAPNQDGTWTESVLARMFRPSQGTDLVFDSAGNLYGETEVEGASGDGTVFRLTPNSDGTWTEEVLYTFTGGSDGGNPSGRLGLDAAGNLYGTASSGGAGYGVVFELTPNSDGTWTENVLHSFTLKDGSDPLSGVTLDTAGNLYGTTSLGGILNCQSRDGGCGVVFKLDTSRKYSVLHKFANHPGANPYVSPILDAAGNLYGATHAGGPADAGVIFKLAPASNGTWAFTVLHVFLGKPAEQPDARLVLDKAGNLYGTTSNSSANGSGGVVFEITP